MAYTHSITVPLPYQQAVERTRQALTERASASSPRPTSPPLSPPSSAPRPPQASAST